MAKKKETIPASPESEQETGIAIIQPTFAPLAEFKMPTLDESIAIIKKKRDKYALLTIDGVGDKEGYEAVKLAMGKMKNDRIAFFNAATENVIDPANKYLKQFKTDLEKVADEFKAGEKELRDKKDFIDNEKERIKAEAELEKVRIMHTRVNDLVVMGAAFDGMVYSFPYDQTLMITAADIKDFSADEFNEFKETAQSSFAVEQQRKETARLQQIDEENERLMQQNQVEQQAIVNQQEATALIEKRTKLRIKEIKLLGYSDDGAECYAPAAESKMPVVHKESLEAMEDISWDELIYDLEHFTPAEDLLVKEEPDPDNEPLHHEAHGYCDYKVPSPNAEPETLAEKLAEVGLVEEILRFDKEEAYTDIIISKKHVMRVYPDHYTEEALEGYSAIGGQGKLQSLNWVILPV